MLLDDSCHFLAVDFDGGSWRDDATAFLETSRKLEVPVALERSRSGNGGHVWMFFDEALPPGLARRLGSLILTEAMEERADLGFRSYDRFFPNQDTLPRGGFGNLIALPLQRGPRRNGNSVFVDSEFVPYPDQWAFLSELRRIPSAQAESIVSLAEKRGPVMGVAAVVEDEDVFADAPWAAPPSRRLPRPPIGGPLPDLVGDRSRRPGLRCQGLLAAGHRRGAHAVSRISESRVLPGAGDAPFDVRQTEDHRLRGAWIEIHGISKGLSGTGRRTARPVQHQVHDQGRAQLGSPSFASLRRRPSSGTGSGGESSAIGRHWRSGGGPRVREDCRGRMVDCGARRQHPGHGPSPTVAGSVDRPVVRVSGHLGRGDRSPGRGTEEAHRNGRHRHDAEPGAARRGGRLRRGLRLRDRGRVPPCSRPRIRTGRRSRQGEVRRGTVGDGDEEGRSSPHRVHAVRSRPAPGGCRTAGTGDAVHPRRVRPAHRLPRPRRTGRRSAHRIPADFASIGCRRAQELSDLRGRGAERPRRAGRRSC